MSLQLADRRRYEMRGSEAESNEVYSSDSDREMSISHHLCPALHWSKLEIHCWQQCGSASGTSSVPLGFLNTLRDSRR
jgi:hypothetical protein